MYIYNCTLKKLQNSIKKVEDLYLRLLKQDASKDIEQLQELVGKLLNNNKPTMKKKVPPGKATQVAILILIEEKKENYWPLCIWPTFHSGIAF